MSTSEPTQWRTNIADPHHGDDILIKGYSVLELIGKVDFVSAIYLVMLGELPNAAKRDMMNALFVSVIDHGISPSSTTTRFIAASGVPVQAAVAGGLMTFGDIHGGAGEEFSRFLSEAEQEGTTRGESIAETANRMVAEARAVKRRLPGFGHPQHPDGDPRAPRLIAEAQRLGVIGRHVELAIALEKRMAEALGRRVALNIDGAVGSIILDLGFHWRHARPFILISRCPGLCAHAIEEVVREKGWRAIPLDQVTYDGPARRPVPESKG